MKHTGEQSYGFAQWWVVGRVGANATPQLLYLKETGPAPIVLEAGWAAGPVSMVAENINITCLNWESNPEPSNL
jgi:hypothetical protein